VNRENVSQQRTPDDEIQSPRCEPEWKQIAEEMSKEQDSAKLIELSQRLIDAFDNQQRAASRNSDSHRR